ncbi:MAG: hypothetical protein GXX90_06815 [Microbacteriaceae bacterium]|nr:hypothetical protein [Microbacteriaceae bacterium]
MPWWSWVLIWTGLVVLLLVVLALGAIMLWRKATAALDELERLEQVQHGFADLVGERVAPFAPAVPALLRPRAEVAAEHEAAVLARDERREARREARLARGRALTRADPMRFAHLAEPPRTTAPRHE